MLAAIKHGFGNLVNFSGRDARQAFWYFVLILYAAEIALVTILSAPAFAQAMLAGVQEAMAAAEAGNAATTDAAIQSAMMQSMANAMSTTMWITSAANLVLTVLLAAAFVRRLHDSGLAGWWGLLPGVLHVANVFAAPATMQRMMDRLAQASTDDPLAGIHAMQGSIGLSSLLGWGAIILLVVLGVRKSTPGPNRYGLAPFVA